MYAELSCRSNFSFLKGASHPEELLARADALELAALALTDDDGFYGVPKAHLFNRATRRPLKLVVGSAVTLTVGPRLNVYVVSAEGYANLCRVLSLSRLAHPKGQAGVGFATLAERSAGLLAMLPSPHAPATRVAQLAEAFPGRF